LDSLLMAVVRVANAVSSESGGRALRRIPRERSSSSLPESAVAWNVPAHMAALPVTLPATYLQTAMQDLKRSRINDSSGDADRIVSRTL
jgi:hypothetical protein